ncbi:MAG: VOC family protein [Burkholderiales bacterium]|nr:VOC family protein [Burkholderiales bacterium]
MTDPGKPRVRKLVPSLGVSDLHRSIAFYRDFFGFALIDSWENAAGEAVWCWLRSGTAELMLQQLTPEQQITLEPALGQSWVMYLRPADIDETRRQLLQAGVEVSAIELTAYGARECFLTDPDGYELWLSVPERGVGGDDEEEDDDQDQDDEDEAVPPDDTDEDSLAERRRGPLH